MPVVHYIFHQFRHANSGMMENSEFRTRKRAKAPVFTTQILKYWWANQTLVFISRWHLIRLYKETQTGEVESGIISKVVS